MLSFVGGIFCLRQRAVVRFRSLPDRWSGPSPLPHSIAGFRAERPDPSDRGFCGRFVLPDPQCGFQQATLVPESAAR